MLAKFINLKYLQVLLSLFLVFSSCRHISNKNPDSNNEKSIHFPDNPEATAFDENGSYNNFIKGKFVGEGQIPPRAIIPSTNGELVIDRSNPNFDPFLDESDYHYNTLMNNQSKTNTNINDDPSDNQSLSDQHQKKNNTNVMPVSIKHDSVDDEIKHYAFDLITDTGKQIFLAAREYMQKQALAEYQSYAQPLMCVKNVVHVLRAAGLDYLTADTANISSLIDLFQRNAANLHYLPNDPENLENHFNQVIGYLKTNFGADIKIPTGSIIVGCEKSCAGHGKASGAHVSILGDTNDLGQLMVYHNNWFRPNTLKGRRVWYMVKVNNFYYKQRPRQWMPSPWIKIDRADLHKSKSALAYIDDLDPFNNKYEVLIIIPNEIKKELAQNKLINHHKYLNNIENVHSKDYRSYMQDPANKNYICVSKIGLKHLDPRVFPGSSEKHPAYYAMQDVLDRNPDISFAFNDSFEFIRLQSSYYQGDLWYGIKLYDISKFFGSSSDTRVWIKVTDQSAKFMVDCKLEKQIFLTNANNYN